jgi:monoterpene epsilon-lactone hydrolase
MPSDNFLRLLAALERNQMPPGPIDVASRRAEMESLAFSLPDDILTEETNIEGMPCLWMVPPKASMNRSILYLHGGGYVTGSPRTHARLAAQLARNCGASVLVPAYRLAPEYPYPAALEDSVAGYNWLLDRSGGWSNVVVAGDSAGGGLAIATLLELAKRGLPMPAAAALISPWIDLSLTISNDPIRDQLDPVNSLEKMRMYAQLYRGRGTNTPEDPLSADLSPLPPMVIHVGGAELLLSDSEVFADRARQQGVPVSIEVWPDMVHDWHLFDERGPESADAIVQLGTMVRASARWDLTTDTVE